MSVEQPWAQGPPAPEGPHDCTVSVQSHSALRPAAETPNTPAPFLLGEHYEGEFSNTSWQGCMRMANIWTSALQSTGIQVACNSQEYNVLCARG